MSSNPFYKRPPTTQKTQAYDWPPKRIERPVRVSRQEPPPPQVTSADEESFKMKKLRKIE